MVLCAVIYLSQGTNVVFPTRRTCNSHCASRARDDELLYVLQKLLNKRVWPGSLWAALSDDPTKYAVEQPGM